MLHNQQSLKNHLPHALGSPTQRTDFRGISPYTSHPAPSEEAMGSLAIAKKARRWKYGPLIGENHGCSSNTGGSGVYFQKTPHDEHYTRLRTTLSPIYCQNFWGQIAHHEKGGDEEKVSATSMFYRWSAWILLDKWVGPLTNQVPCAFKSIHVSTFSQRE